MRPPGEEIVAWEWETIFALLPPKHLSFSELPLWACSAIRDPPFDFR